MLTACNVALLVPLDTELAPACISLHTGQVSLSSVLVLTYLPVVELARVAGVLTCHACLESHSGAFTLLGTSLETVVLKVTDSRGARIIPACGSEV